MYVLMEMYDLIVSLLQMPTKSSWHDEQCVVGQQPIWLCMYLGMWTYMFGKFSDVDVEPHLKT